MIEEDIPHNESTDSVEKEGGSKEENKNENISSNDDDVKNEEIPNPYENYIDQM